MTVLEQCQMFWNDWGNTDPDFYKVFVGAGLTEDDYKDITGVAYKA